MKKLLLTTALLLASCAPAYAQQIDDWHYSQSVDAMTDEDRSSAMTFDGQSAFLSVSCMADGPMLIASPGQYLTNDEPLKTTWRIDGGEPVTRTLPAVESLVIMPYAVSERLETAESIVIRFSDYRGRTYTHTFSLVGFSDATGLLGCVK